MKKTALILCIVFTCLTVAGAGFVLFYGGRVNAGYAVVPMVLALTGLAAYRGIK